MYFIIKDVSLFAFLYQNKNEILKNLQMINDNLFG